MIKRLIIRWRFRAMTRHFDRAITKARARHMPVRHLQEAKKSFVHACLRGEVRG